VKEANLKVAGYPRIEKKDGAADAERFEFSATFEVYPEVKVGDLASAKIERPQVSVDDAAVDKTIDILRKQRTRFVAVERAAKEGDRITVDFEGKIDGQVFQGGSAENFVFGIDDGRMLPEFNAAARGMTPGESKTFDLTFPADYHGKEVAGKQASFTLRVKKIEEPQLPELDAEFAKSLGVADGDVSKMRAEVRANLEREVKGRLKARVKDQVMQALLDATQVEVPKALVESEIERLRELTKQDFAARGIPVKDDMPLPADIFEKQATRRVNLGLILAEVVRTHQLQAKPEQVRAIVEEQAQSYENPQEVVRWYYQSPERLREIESMVLEDNVVDWALRTAKVEDKPIEFDELMGNRS